ncbi:hypothetical protein AB0I77_46280 [Streptomyces sp. NPDC050619]|uniref:hypothetical protein n=1 Tax=Streptomyces sp. NPDC050619 TaxID=3157214 RepID=UPI00343D9A24
MQCSAVQWKPTTDLGDELGCLRRGQSLDDHRFLAFQDRQLHVLVERGVEILEERLGQRAQ